MSESGGPDGEAGHEGTVTGPEDITQFQKVWDVRDVRVRGSGVVEHKRGEFKETVD